MLKKILPWTRVILLSFRDKNIGYRGTSQRFVVSLNYRSRYARHVFLSRSTQCKTNDFLFFPLVFFSSHFFFFVLSSSEADLKDWYAGREVICVTSLIKKKKKKKNITSDFISRLTHVVVVPVVKFGFAFFLQILGYEVSI